MTPEQIRNTFQGRKPGAVGPHREYSVLVPFVETKDGLYLLYEVRAKDMKTQPGEICFPGGHVEPGERPRDCALRETEEEAGIPRSHIELVGEANTLHSGAGFSMYPFIGILSAEAYEHAVRQKDEVDELFLISVDRLAEVRPQRYFEKMVPQIQEDFPYETLGIDRDYHWRTGRMDILLYEIDGRIIWGLTARVTRDVLKTLGAAPEPIDTEEEA